MFCRSAGVSVLVAPLLVAKTLTVSALSQVLYSRGKLLRVSCEGRRSLLRAAVEVAAVNSSCWQGLSHLTLLRAAVEDAGVNSSCWLPL